MAGDLLGVRPYRRGDSLRGVHRPQSARQGHLIVCELESLALPRVQIVLDTHPDAHSGHGPDGSLEWAVRVAASFAEDWIDQGADVEVVCGGGTVVAPAGTVAARRAGVLDALARLEPDGRLTLSDVLDGPSCRRSGGGLRVVVMTDRSAPRPVDGGVPGRAERLVVLAADAFGDGRCPAPAAAPTVRPWVWLDDPSNVPAQVRRGRKEVSDRR